MPPVPPKASLSSWHAPQPSSPAPLTAAFYREQAKACLTVARHRVSAQHRETFVRMALHWRRVARAYDVQFAEAA